MRAFSAACGLWLKGAFIPGAFYKTKPEYVSNEKGSYDPLCGFLSEWVYLARRRGYLMGKKTEFYVRCIKQAWNGSFDLANAWGPLLGAAILGGALWLVDKKLGMPDTIPGTIVFTLMCLGLAWLIIFLGRVVYFAGSLFVAKEEELRQASERLTPKLKCTFGDDVPGCVRTNTKVKFQMIGPDAQ